ncbi:pentapeptide repeat-containing protein [Micromonospora sp. 067-2]|uniref:pentapeptide repeat-containing protein n=1 Tax=Micromonospora sp. 067-2 TaxID=2789270 RepID=UPI0039785555
MLRLWPVVTAVVMVVLLGGFAAMWLLGVWSPITPTVKDPERLRLDRIKTALTVAAGLAAGITLLLTLRRQALSERAQRFTEHDAIEQRITGLYIAAAGQLGSDKAAVRLAGLYALERLGQDTPKLRQTVADVLCAYLRMPYTPPQEVLNRSPQSSPHFVSPEEEFDPEEQSMRREELQVRLTAQRLLGNHLRADNAEDPEPPSFWRGTEGERMSLDLVDAVLVDFDLWKCHVDGLDLRGAQLYGSARFRKAQFHGDILLIGAQFHAKVDFGEARFMGSLLGTHVTFWGALGLSAVHCFKKVDLERAHFHEGIYMGHAKLEGVLNLRSAIFWAQANLSNAEFRDVSMRQTHFRGDLELRGSRFRGDMSARDAEIQGTARLNDVRFEGTSLLVGARFRDRVEMRDVTFHSDSKWDAVWLLQGIDLRGARFEQGASLRTIVFHGPIHLEGCRLADVRYIPSTWRALIQAPDGLWSVGVAPPQAETSNDGESRDTDEAPKP